MREANRRSCGQRDNGLVSSLSPLAIDKGEREEGSVYPVAFVITFSETEDDDEGDTGIDRRSCAQRDDDLLFTESEQSRRGFVSISYRMIESAWRKEAGDYGRKIE
jgi:hypothetical protein